MSYLNCWIHINLRKRKSEDLQKNHFDPYKEISESVHRAALDAAFANVCITCYDDYLERLKEGYAQQDIKLGHNKAVKVATFLSNKRMVIKEGKEYKINPNSHY